MHFVNADGCTLMVRRGIDGPGPQGWPNNWYFHQPALEQLLRNGVERFANVDVHLGREIADVAELDARYVVGCDGARSLVRRAIGSRQQDLGLHQPWLVVDLLCKPDSSRVKAFDRVFLEVFGEQQAKEDSAPRTEEAPRSTDGHSRHSTGSASPASRTGAR